MLHPRYLLEGGSLQGGQHSLKRNPFVSGLSERPSRYLLPLWAVPDCRQLLAGSELVLDVLVPEQLLLTDRGLQAGGGL